MDLDTPVDDAAEARSRPMTALHQAEMIAVRNPDGQVKMRMHKSLDKHFLLFPCLWIIMHLLTSASCASLEITNHSTDSSNASSNQSNFTNPTNLSELIEYSPISLEDDLREWEEKMRPKIFKVRLRTGLTVRKHGSDNRTGVLEYYDGIFHPNVTDTPYSEVEFGDRFYDLTEWEPSTKREARMVSADEKTDMLFDPDEETSEEDSSNDNHLTSGRSDEDHQTDRSARLSNYPLGRQFVFPPYSPGSPYAYDKDAPPDEKISFHDVLPVKAVKFIKSMVEDADWNGMFKSMVRTVVDHFVNKIIDKMFSEKDHHLIKRSLEELSVSEFSLPPFGKPLFRSKRATNTKNPTDQVKDIFNMPARRARQELDVDKKKTVAQRISWYDHFLEFVFPNQNPDESDDDSFDDRLKKRDTANSELFKILLKIINTFEKSSDFLKDAKKVLRHKMLKEFSQYYHKHDPSTSSSSYVDAMKMSHRKVEKVIPHLSDVANYISARSMRRRRSTKEYLRKMENRLWQHHSHRHRPHSYSSREDCSLRNACNAGRLLARIPSIPDLALQLRSGGNEPHWDALIWGMKNKGCSRILCKRPRFPKGSKKSWDYGKERLKKRILSVTEPPETLSESDNLAA